MNSHYKCSQINGGPPRYPQVDSHRVDRVLDFFSSRPNWDNPTPTPAGECVLSPALVPWEGGGGNKLASGRGVGGSQFGQGDRHCGT